MTVLRLAWAALIVFTAWQTEAAKEAKADFDMFVLQQDWAPNYCESSGCIAPLVGAFTVYGFVPTNSNGENPADSKQKKCPGTPFDAAQIPATVASELACMWFDSNGDNQALWQASWDREGRCSGLTIAQYFTSITTAYNASNLNAWLAEGGATLSIDDGASPSLDRDEMLAIIEARLGKKSAVQCDPSTKRLTYVDICLDRTTQQPVDCPWGYQPSTECEGPILMATGVAPSTQCAAYFPKTIPGAFPALAASPSPGAPPSPSPSASPSPSPSASPSPANASPPPEDAPSPSPPPPPGAPSALDPSGQQGAETSSSGSNVGVIAGAVAGAVVAVVAAIAAFVVWRKRSRRRQSGTASSAGASAGTGGGSKTDFVLPVDTSQRWGPNQTDTFVLPGSSGTGGGGPGAYGSVAGGLTPAPVAVYSAAAAPQAPLSAMLPSGAAAGAGPVARAAAGSPLAAGMLRASAGQDTDSKGSTGGFPGAVAHPPMPLSADHPTRTSALTASATTSRTHATLSSTDPFLTLIRSQLASGSSAGGVSAVGLDASRRLSAAQASQWAIPFEQLDIIKPIGEGSFGRVYESTWLGQVVAVKLLLDAKQAQQALATNETSPLVLKMEEEAGIMLAMRHPCCVALLGYCVSPPCLVCEFAERGSLTEVLNEALKDGAAAAQLTWQRRLVMALDAAKGMAYLHSRTPPIIHRDMKSPNLLVTADWHVKVSDFNLSKFLTDSTRSSSLAAMNPRWLAPEVMQGERATMQADVFAFAVVMWELLTWEVPWSGGNAWQLVSLVTQGGRLDIPQVDQLPGTDRLAPAQLDAYVALMRRCWAQNLYDRPTFTEVIADLRRLLEEVEAAQAAV